MSELILRLTSTHLGEVVDIIDHYIVGTMVHGFSHIHKSYLLRASLKQIFSAMCINAQRWVQIYPYFHVAKLDIKIAAHSRTWQACVVQIMVEVESRVAACHLITKALSLDECRQNSLLTLAVPTSPQRKSSRQRRPKHHFEGSMDDCQWIDWDK